MATQMATWKRIDVNMDDNTDGTDGDMNGNTDGRKRILMEIWMATQMKIWKRILTEI